MNGFSIFGLSDSHWNCFVSNTWLTTHRAVSGNRMSSCFQVKSQENEYNKNTKVEQCNKLVSEIYLTRLLATKVSPNFAGIDIFDCYLYIFYCEKITATEVHVHAAVWSSVVFILHWNGRSIACGIISDFVYRRWRWISLWRRSLRRFSTRPPEEVPVFHSLLNISLISLTTKPCFTESLTQRSFIRGSQTGDEYFSFNIFGITWMLATMHLILSNHLTFFSCFKVFFSMQNESIKSPKL